MLLHFGEKQDWQDWVAPSDAALQLRALSRHLWSLTRRLTAERNRLARSKRTRIDALLREDIEIGIEQLAQRIETLRGKAEELIEADVELSAMFALLLTIPGIASVSAVQLIGELSTLPTDMTAKQLVAHAGLDPRSNESGSSVRGRVRISKQGSGHLRRILFMPAIVARTHSPQVRAWSRELEQRGKTPKQAVVAVMRKLLHAIWGMLKSGTAWDGDRFDGRAASNGFEPEPEPARPEPATDATADGDRPDAAGQGRATQKRGEGRPDRDGAPLRQQDGVVNVPQEVACSRTAT